jgi:pyruvate formate lyase activating enzyme
LADLWIVDLKIWDDDAHRKLTGRTIRLILGNYERLAASGRPMLTRIPVIPGCTDSEENLAALAKYVAKVNPGGRVELMFYNPLAESKYRNYDIDFPLYGLKPYDAAQQERFRGIIAAASVQVI